MGKMMELPSSDKYYKLSVEEMDTSKLLANASSSAMCASTTIFPSSTAIHIITKVNP